jgi:hypothetical protein
LALALVAGVALAFMNEGFVTKRSALFTLLLTTTLIIVTGWYVWTTGRIAKENEKLSKSSEQVAKETAQLARQTSHLAKETAQLASETKVLAASGIRGLFMLSLPVIAVRELDQGERNGRMPRLVLRNVGQAAAIITRLTVTLGHLGGGNQILDSADYGRPLLNLGQGHQYALAPGDDLVIHLGTRDPGGSLVAFDPAHSSCVVEYQDVAGNQFSSRHDPETYFEVCLTGHHGEPEHGLWPLSQGLSIDPATGRVVPISAD